MFRFKSSVVTIVNAVAFLCFAALLVTATFYDLQISCALSDGESLFALFFAVVGELPAYLVLPVAGVIVYYNHDLYQNKYASAGIRICGAALSVGGWIFFGINGTKLTEIPYLWAFAVFFGIVAGAFGLWTGSLVEMEKMHRLFKFAVFAIVFTLVSVAVMQVMKNIWCRMRYRDMLKVGSEEGFSRWYEIMLGRQDMIEGGDYTSFPSGHTSSAVHIFLLAALCDFIPGWDNRRVRIGINVGCTLFSAAVALSRIVANAHFLSDVLVGGYLTYLIFVVLRKAFFGKGKYNFDFCKGTDGEEHEE